MSEYAGSNCTTCRPVTRGQLCALAGYVFAWSVIMASGSQFMIPGHSDVLEQAWSLERKFSLMVLLGEILLMLPYFQLETPVKGVVIIVSDQIREA